MALSAIPVLPPERLKELQAKMLRYLIENGQPPDYAVSAAKIEQDLGITRDEIRATHNHMLYAGQIAERGRSGHIGLSGPGQLAAKMLLEPDED
jgi:hypothetical protein